MNTRSSASPNSSWWLEPGTETCEFCLRSYHYEAGYYCAECDRPVCPLCVAEIHVTRRLICPFCRAEDD